MKKSQQRWLLLACCLLFAALLVLSIRYQSLRLDTGMIRQPRLQNDTLKTK